MNAYIINVKQLVRDQELDFDDRRFRPSGEYTIEAEDQEAAFDEFHSTVPIAVLDDFEINIKLFKTNTTR